ncbi:Modulator of FtsH protease HflK [Candidatus Methanoperedenaceae archaeon GB50]|nr:Modulator of FtsH protease HflK [Candidatus Methanoperedenaceae archaeon GB50]
MSILRKAVVKAFKDVASAKEDKSKFINEAQAYRNDILPQAKGKAAQIINEAMAYKETRIKRAEGEMQRFLSRLKAYKQAPKIIRSQVYLDTMEKILAQTREIIVPEKVEKIILPLNQPSQTLPSMEGRKTSLTTRGK